jgi:hypothetical protein
MTVIASAYSPEGFVIAADGRRRNEGDLSRIVTDKAQKIFFGSHPQLSFAYAWAGRTSFDLPSGLRFSFLTETHNCITALAECKTATTFIGYISVLSELLVSRLLEANNYVMPLNGSNLNQEMVRLVMVGYFEGKAMRSQIRFNHKDGWLQPEIFDITENPLDFNIFSGSELVFKELAFEEPPNSVSDAHKMVERYIRRCVEASGVLPDCKDYGGHIHIASVTPNGQSWIIPPLE